MIHNKALRLCGVMWFLKNLYTYKTWFGSFARTVCPNEHFSNGNFFEKILKEENQNKRNKKGIKRKIRNNKN